MANILDYVKNSSKYTFDELPFNEIDNVIFASISYLNLDGIVSNSYYNPVTIEYAGTNYFNKYTKKTSAIMSLLFNLPLKCLHPFIKQIAIKI